VPLTSLLGPGLLLTNAVGSPIVKRIQEKIQNNPNPAILPADADRLFKAYNESAMMGGTSTTQNFKLYAKIIELDNSLASAGAGTDYTNGHHKKDIFKDIKVGGKGLIDQLNDPVDGEKNDEGRVILDNIDSFLELEANTTDTINTYTEQMQKLCQLMVDPNSKFKPSEFLDYLHILKSDTVQAIKDQQHAEITAIKALFDEGENLDKMKIALGNGGDIATPAQVESVKKEMLKALEESQKKELEKFEKSTTDTLIKTHKISRDEFVRVSTLARFYNNKHNKEMMDKLIEDLRKANMKPSDANVEAEFSNGLLNFKGISVQDLPLIKTLTGQDIHQTKPGTFTMKLPNRILSPLYYSNWKTSLKEDMSDIVQAVRACGYSKINLTINHKDAEHALKMAKAAYAASREQGFEADKINIVVNGEKKTAEEIFKDTPSELQAIESKAQHYEQQREAYLPKEYEEGATYSQESSPTELEAFKAKLNALKAEKVEAGEEEVAEEEEAEEEERRPAAG
jgi:hypothetical protein